MQVPEGAALRPPKAETRPREQSDVAAHSKLETPNSKLETGRSSSMYRTCLFCQSDLGANESVERFPVGRRLAYDARKGRLWVVCPRCARWNLTPLEERWEAIEQCERLYRGTRLRASTENVGLARLREGLELVRIGSPLRPEFAAWRYSAKFARRRRDAQLVAAAGATLTVAVGVAAAPVLGPVLALGALSVVAVPGLTTALAVVPIVGTLALRDYLQYDRVIGRVVTPTKRVLTVRAKHLDYAELHARRDGSEPELDLPHDGGWAHIDGGAALRVLSQLIAGANRLGATDAQVREAVRDVDDAGDAATYLARASTKGDWRFTRVMSLLNEMRGLGALRLSPAERLALEMALNEESERRALEGELAQLEQAWRDAEEIAAIADSLLPEAISSRFSALGEGGHSGS
jgi:hypothetical protein